MLGRDLVFLTALSALAVAAPTTWAQDGVPKWNRRHQKKVAGLAERWWKARPPTKFDVWDAAERAELR